LGAKGGIGNCVIFSFLMMNKEGSNLQACPQVNGIIKFLKIKE
jgi:hypothetical protein